MLKYHFLHKQTKNHDKVLVETVNRKSIYTHLQLCYLFIYFSYNEADFHALKGTKKYMSLNLLPKTWFQNMSFGEQLGYDFCVTLPGQSRNI